MRLESLARQMRVDPSDLLASAQRLGLEVDGPDSVLTHEDEWALRKESASRQPDSSAGERPAPPGFRSPPPQALAHRRRPRGPVPEPSDLAKVFLRHDAASDDALFNPPPRHVRVQRAEARALEWARHLFNAQEAQAWLDANGEISAGVAASLRAAGLTPEQAAVRVRTPRGYLHKLPLAIRVASGELTAAEAAAELRATAQRPENGH